MSVRRVLLYVGVGILIYLAMLIATIPAPWAGQAVERLSQQRLQVREPAGTVWSGTGRLYAARRSGPPVELGALRWRTSWAGILSATLTLDIALGEATKPVTVELSPSGMNIRGVELAVPAQAIASFAPELESFGPEGWIRLRSDDLRIDDESILGLAELQWRQVRLARMPGVEFGSHLVRLRGGGSKVDIELATLDGPLRVSGRGTFTRRDGLSVSGTAEHVGPPTPVMTAFLRGMCPDYRDDRCTFHIRQQPR